MKISVIIPVYNEAKVILACLISMSKQTYQDFEMIVVDDGSKDQSKAKILVAKKYFTKQKLLLASQDHQGPAMARNLGANKAGGEILVFVDADMTFDKRFLLELTEPIINAKTKGTTSHEEFVANWENAWARMWNYNHGIADDRLHKRIKKKDRVFRAVLTSEFRRVSGFAKGGYTDDYTLGKKLGYQAMVVKGARFYHKNPASFQEVFSQARWTGKREYKLGKVGAWLVLIRYSLPFTLGLGLWGAIRFHEPKFILFKLVYNTAMTIGILEYNFFGKGAK